ncbi:HD domain-containing phosphohydrolase [Meiothermus granaticius]|uniref:Cyclic di-GMP phosphodiesterase response regulator RpfG n=1 Tax=Meiothermus granaticius NBRC 107808 TaxID=1227551 RepID=A0A399FCQ8_9DEIN|nr:HD domain-containing phosphohydrolase [Meiothermus granaticius]RIH94030.1 Cyclic di-GMP phosphodiesterase response regulator RpfG [Meiothermus granaticius NBRC 107808]GEM88484.1 diguanylate cyclase [Meiothermus granaticius NBRC 107808]
MAADKPGIATTVEGTERASRLGLARSRLREAEALLAEEPAEALNLATEVLENAAALGEPELQIQARLVLAQAQGRLGRMKEALDHAGIALAEAPEKRLQLESSRLLAFLQRERGDLVQAASHLEQAAGLARELELPQVEADLLNQQAGLHHMQAQYPEALDKLRAALGLMRQLGNRAAEANYLNNLGTLHTELGDYPEALQNFFAAYQLYQEEGHSPRNRATNLASIGNLYGEMGEYAQAQEYYDRALGIARAGEERSLEVHLLHLKGELARAQDKLEEAQALYTEVLSLAQERGLERLIASGMLGLAQIQTTRGHLQEALLNHTKVLELARAKGWRHAELEALLGLAHNHLALEHLRLAQAQAEEALELAHRFDRKKNLCEAHHLLAQIHRAEGRLEPALAHLEAHYRLERELFNREGERKRRLLASQLELERARNEAEQYRLRTEVETRAREEAQAKVRQRTEELEYAQLEIVARLALAAEYRDDVTGEHTYRVGRNAALIAQEMGWPQEQIEVLRSAARLHDVGKIGIPDSILLKRDRLTLEEFEQMKAHTVIGARILSGGRSRLLRMAEEIARSHHEHYDGNGYPFGLVGSDIPLSGRIVAAADVLDALTHERPYKRAWSVAEALAEIRRLSGRHFDPQVVEACMRAFGEGELDIEAKMQRLDADLSMTMQIEKAQLGWIEEDVEGLRRGFEQILADRTRELEAARREAQMLARRMELMAHTDVLTGLGNRRAFENDLETEVARAHRIGYPLSVLALDMDYLKVLNDSEGHERGDALLRTFAQVTQEHFFALGRLYRIGGDEYAAILPYIDPTGHPEVRARLEAALAQVRALGFPAASVSAGLAAIPMEATSGGELVRLSDQRMYADKLARRNPPQR